MRALADSYLQLDSAGIRPSASAKRLQQEAYRAWFVGLLFNAVAGTYTLWQLRQREQSIDKNDGEGVVESKKIFKYILMSFRSLNSADEASQGKEYYEPSAYLRPLRSHYS